ncbi:MAG TPA: hypothetical protein VIL79_03800 [Thermoleophilia bacterium]
MTVEKLNSQGLHQPVDNRYAHVVRALGAVQYRIGGHVPVGLDGANLHAGDMAAQIRECYEQVTSALTAVALVRVAAGPAEALVVPRGQHLGGADAEVRFNAAAAGSQVDAEHLLDAP